MQFSGSAYAGYIECEGASFLRLARVYLGRERRMNSMRGLALKLVSSEFGTRNSISLIVVSLCLDCKRETPQTHNRFRSIFSHW